MIFFQVDETTKDLEAPNDLPQTEVNEPLAVHKEAFCLGCPIVIDLSIPENRKTIQKYLETPVVELLSHGPYKSVTPTILSATKQVSTLFIIEAYCILNKNTTCNNNPLLNFRLNLKSSMQLHLQLILLHVVIKKLEKIVLHSQQKDVYVPLSLFWMEPEPLHTTTAHLICL